MRKFTVEPGKDISPDVGLSDDFTIRTVDDSGETISFVFEPREWLQEWQILRRAELPPGASYRRLLLISAAPFEVHFLTNRDDERLWRFTLHDIVSQTNRKLTLADSEISFLAEEVRRHLDP